MRASCGPNVAIKWDRAALTLTLYALRAIPEGTEIHKTYLDPALPRAERTAHLLKNYRFPCDCPWCAIRTDAAPLDPAELTRVAVSDARRGALGRWIFTHLRYKKWSRDLARADDVVITEHLEALELIRLEGMEGLQNLFVEEIAMCYALLGDLDEFVRWGKMTVQLSRIEDPPVAARFEEWLVNPPKRMKQWAWRKKQRRQCFHRSCKHKSHSIQNYRRRAESIIWKRLLVIFLCFLDRKTNVANCTNRVLGRRGYHFKTRLRNKSFCYIPTKVEMSGIIQENRQRVILYRHRYVIHLSDDKGVTKDQPGRKKLVKVKRKVS